MILNLIVSSYYYNFYRNFNCNVESHRKKMQKFTEVSCHYFIIAFILYKGLMIG